MVFCYATPSLACWTDVKQIPDEAAAVLTDGRCPANLSEYDTAMEAVSLD
ncbi:MAG: hypothetical protein V3S15_05805 [Woeseiaceae bacterium]